METNLERYSEKKHKIRILWENIKNILGEIKILWSKIFNLERQLKSLQKGVDKVNYPTKKVEIALSDFSNLNDTSDLQITHGNTILTLFFPTGSYTQTGIYITYQHNLNITSTPIIAILSCTFVDSINNIYKYITTANLYAIDSNSITFIFPETYQFSGANYNISNMKLWMVY